MLLIVLFTAVPKEQPRSVPASQALCRWVTRTCFGWNSLESEWTRGKCHFMEGRTELERRFSKKNKDKVLGQNFWAKLSLFFLCHVTIPVPIDAPCNGSSYSSCSVRSSYSLASLYFFYFPKIKGVSKPQMFTEKPACKCYWSNFLYVSVGLLCVFQLWDQVAERSGNPKEQNTIFERDITLR